MRLTGKTFLTIGFLALGAVSAIAQPVISAKSGMISRAEGEVFIGDTLVESSQTNFPEVKENATLRTEAGRAEVLLTRGVYMRIGESASFKMLTTRLIDTRLEILTGSAIVEADEIVKDNNLTILAGEATVSVTKHGLYRFDMKEGTIKVFDGTASVAINGETVLVGSGRLLKVEAGKPVIEKFNKEDTDALDHWSKRRAEQIARANPSSAKQVYDAGCDPYSNGTYGNRRYGAPSQNQGSQWAAASSTNPTSPCYNPCDSWRYNPWYGIITYIPCGANVYSPYGYRYWGPGNVMRAYYVPPPPTRGGGFGNGGFGGGNNFPSMGNTSGGYSGAMSTGASPGMSSSPAAAATTGTTSAGSAGTSSAGHGSGGGHGK
jgi:hypothetical protein